MFIFVAGYLRLAIKQKGNFLGLPWEIPITQASFKLGIEKHHVFFGGLMGF